MQAKDISITTRLVRIALPIILCFVNANLHAQTAALFESDEILEFTLKFERRALMKDRGDDPQYHPATIEYQEGEKKFNKTSKRSSC